MKKWVIIISVAALLGILIFFWNFDEQDLGENYFWLPKYEAIDVGYGGSGIVYKSTQKNVFEDIKIQGNVCEVNANKDFVIAIQNTDTVYFENSKNSPEKKPLRYFIIAKKTDSIFGPYLKIDYLRKREQLRIPQQLHFKEN